MSGSQRGTSKLLRHTEGTDSADLSRALQERLRAGDHADIHAGCRPVADILSRIGDKWSVLIVMLLGAEAKRFSEIKRLVGGISQRMLTLTLRGLERDGFVRRTVHPTTPPSVDYALTDLGHSLLGPISQLGEWAFANRDEVVRARLRFDATVRKPVDPPGVHRIGH
jgi:DNA-binding HxlR family transcriptional regulator